MAGGGGANGEAPVVVQIDKLKFTYPGIDGAPPPGAKPLIEDFSLTLRAGDRCLLVGANGAGLDRLNLLSNFFLVKFVLSIRFLLRNCMRSGFCHCTGE